jgi:hypothetical protein
MNSILGVESVDRKDFMVSYGLSVGPMRLNAGQMTLCKLHLRCTSFEQGATLTISTSTSNLE